MTFRVTYEPDGDGWLVRIPSVRGCHTFGKTISIARRNIREALSTCIDVFGKDVDRIAKHAILVDTLRDDLTDAQHAVLRTRALARGARAMEKRHAVRTWTLPRGRRGRWCIVTEGCGVTGATRRATFSAFFLALARMQNWHPK